MDSLTESSLISSLEASDFTSVYNRFIHFLHPFSDFISIDSANAPTSTKTKRIATKKKKEPDPNTVRPLAKKFLPFLSRILKILPSILSSKSDDGNAPELLRIYRLALGCLSCISSCLAGKPYSVHLQRVRFLRCLEGCGQYGEAEREGFSILESVREVIAGPLVTKKSKGKSVEVCILPEPMAENAADPDLGMLVVEVVVCVITCVGKGRSKDSAVYWRVLDLVRQVMPWLRGINLLWWRSGSSTLHDNIDRVFEISSEGSIFKVSL